MLCFDVTVMIHMLQPYRRITIDMAVSYGFAWK
jgi:hypothetical protein